MKLLLKSIFLLSLLSVFQLKGQDADYYSGATIPDSLKENANVVVREFTSSFVQNDANSGVYKVRKVMTILNKKGDVYADFGIYEDKFHSLNSFSAVLRNASGKEIKKVKKGDLITSSITTDANTLASDNVTLFYHFTSPSYPYTIEYTFEQKWKNGILSYPPFVPVNNGYNVSVQSAEYKISIPADIKLRFNANYENNLTSKQEGKIDVYDVSFNGFKAIGEEKYAPSEREIFPTISFAPTDFCFDSYCGNMSDWKNYGLWANNLLKDRDIIPADLVNKLKELVKDAQSDKEKVKIVYEYLQNNTRYVNIVFGIGGLQPFKASDVAKTGFGDCKGLSNYMKAMLKAIDIDAYYCEIYLGKELKYLSKDFTNLTQTNHIVVLVPLKNDSVWLECTSSTNPFGYIHEGIAGHDALLITERGGEICRLPSFSDSDNKTISTLNYTLNEDGSMTGDLTLSQFMANSEGMETFFKMNDRNLFVRYINSNIKMPQVDFGEIKNEYNKSERPNANLKVKLASKNIGNKTGSRLFVPICPLEKGNFEMFKASKRQHDIVINSGYTETDTIRITLPESFTLESLPKDIYMKTKYGNLTAKALYQDNQLVYVQNVDLFSGRYDKSEYPDIKSFFDQVISATKRKLVFKKAQ